VRVMITNHLFILETHGCVSVIKYDIVIVVERPTAVRLYNKQIKTDI